MAVECWEAHDDAGNVLATFPTAEAATDWMDEQSTDIAYTLVYVDQQEEEKP